MKRLVFLFVILLLPTLIVAASFETVSYQSKDGLTITADLYASHPETAPFIILFHRARWSRGEYREIAPKLNEMGFNCLAVDQRSGREANDVVNHTARRATDKRKSTTYLDALPDLEASISYVKSKNAKGKLIIWGSSYSASLVLKIAGDNPGIVDGILAFAPGEYFERVGKSNTFIRESARKITVPVFITSAKSEKERWFSIYEAIPSKAKTYYLPDKKGVHGSEALWESTPGHEGYWNAVRPF